MKKAKKGGFDGDSNEIGFEEEENPNEISNISYASNDDHEIVNDDEIDLNSLDFENENENINESENTDNESFATMSEFPSFSESDQNILNISPTLLSDSVSTEKDQSSFAGGRKRRKSRKHKKTQKTSKSKKVRNNTRTKKSKKTKTKTKRTKSAKFRLRKRSHGGFIGDNGTDTERYGETNPYSVERDSDSRF